MKVYMVLCRKTGQWWKRRGTPGAGWYDKQEDGSVWVRRPGNVLTAAKKRDRRNLHDPVIIPFRLEPVIPGVNDGTENVVAVGGHTWHYDRQCDTWMMGENKNGVGVYHDEGYFYSCVTPSGQVISCSHDDRDEAMLAGIAEWEKRQDGQA